MDEALMLPAEKIAALNHPYVNWPLGGSFMQFPDFDAIVASGEPDIIHVEFDLNDDVDVAD
jgi:hypothetical protein